MNGVLPSSKRLERPIRKNERPAGMNRKNRIVELIDATYATTTEPVRYDAFMESWEQYMEACLNAGEGMSLADLENSPVHAHFSRSLEILDRLGNVNRVEKTAADLVNLVLGASIVLDSRGLVVAANDAAERQLSINPENNFRDAKVDPDTIKRILSWIKTSESENESFLFARCTIGDDQTSGCFLATRVILSEQNGRDEAGTSVKHSLVTSIDLQIDTRTIDILIDAFGLSQAEAEVAVALGEGKTPNEIARMRSASINTIRTQIKKILKKTNAHGIPDLVRILCGFAAGYSSNQLATQSTIDSLSISNRQSARRLVLPDGRRLSYIQYGDLNGRPVLFFHTMLYGTAATQSFVDACERQGWRIIAPSRPGFGDSDLNPNAKGEKLVEQTSHDMAHLLAHLEVDQTLILGHVAGSIYAQRFALLFPQRTRGVLFVNHAPHWRDTFMDDLPRRQRLLAKSTRYAPAALPFVTRAGVALIDAGGFKHFINALYRDNPADMKALRRPDVYQAAIEGLKHTVKRGSAGFCLDCPLVLTDWTQEARGLNIPIGIVHGDGDLVVTRRYIDGYMEKVPGVTLTLVEGAGQFLLYSHWPRILEQLKLLDKQASL